MSPDAKKGRIPALFFCTSREVNVATWRVYRYLNHILLTPTAEPRPFEIPRLLSYYAESFSLSVSGAGAPALADGSPVLGVLHR
jgi:hypothetical protein